HGRQRERVAAAEASRRVRKRQDRHHGVRAAVGGVGQAGRRGVAEKHLDQQPAIGTRRADDRLEARRATGYADEESSIEAISRPARPAAFVGQAFFRIVVDRNAFGRNIYDSEESSIEAISSNFFSESKLARWIACESSTHSTSSTSLSCGVSV